MKNKDEKLMICKLYKLGYNMTTIATLVDSVNGHISKVIRSVEDETGIHPRKKGEKSEIKPLNTEFTNKEQVELFSYLLDRGTSSEIISEILGVKVANVEIALKVKDLKVNKTA